MNTTRFRVGLALLFLIVSVRFVYVHETQVVVPPLSYDLIVGLQGTFTGLCYAAWMGWFKEEQ